MQDWQLEGGSPGSTPWNCCSRIYLWVGGNKMQWTSTGGVFAFILPTWNSQCVGLTDVFTMKSEAASAWKGSRKYCLGKQAQEWARGISACDGLSVGTVNSSQNVSPSVKWHNVPLAAEEANVRSFQVLSCWTANKKELNCRSHSVKVTVLGEKKDCCIISEQEFTCFCLKWAMVLFPVPQSVRYTGGLSPERFP